MTKVRYEIELATMTPVGDLDGPARSVKATDLEPLARLMLDAYRGTVDFDDETYDDAVSEVRSFLDDDPALEYSYLVEGDERVVGAVLVTMVEGQPFVSYVMTDPEHKRRHLGRRLVHHALSQAHADGHQRAVFYITRGNTPSEALFAALGAVAVD